MAPTKPNVQSKQDMPPKGGYPKINTVRGIRPRGPSGLMIWGACIGFTIFGFNLIGDTALENRRRVKEKRELRMAVLPFLQSEQDIKMLFKLAQIEQEIAKSVQASKKAHE